MATEKLIVKNFGPIREAELDLRKVTVLIGPQASGKSILAKLVATYYTSSFLKNPPQEFPFEQSRIDAPKNSLSYYGIDVYLYKESEIILKNENFNVSLHYLDLQIDVLNDKIRFKKTEYQRLRSEDFEKLTEIQESYSRNDLEAVGKLSIEKDRIVNDIYNLDHEIANEIGIPIYIPADRILASISQVSQPISSAWFKEDFEQFKQYKKEFDIPVLGISYFYDKKQNKNFVRLNNSETIELNFAASSYQSLTPLFIAIETANSLFKHLFIIEEPELNLYPTTQKKLVEYLLEKCTQGDNRLIITTHSPYILTALNNCIQAKNVATLHPEAVEEVNKLVPSQYQIAYEDVSAYYVGDGTVKSIMNEEFQMIDANALDDVSNDLGAVFDKLLDLKYQNQE